MDYSLMLYGLAFECPFKNQQEDCSVKTIRRLKNFKDKVGYIDSLTDIEKKEIYLKHKKCAFKLENNIIEVADKNV